MTQPRNNRLPLRWAVFKFGLAHECVDLVEILREKSGADRIEIDLTGPEPAFIFVWKDGHHLFGRPWAILGEPIADPIAQRTLSERSANMRPATAKEQAVSAARCQAVPAATGLVWHQFMVWAFNRAVSIGAVVLYARPKAVTADFAQLPADVRAMLDVADWENGIAVALDNTAYLSVHAMAASDAQEISDDAGAATSPAPGTTLRNANSSTIEAALQAEYEKAQSAGEKPPNIKEVPRLVQVRLEAEGYYASQREIAKAAEAFKDRRRRPGRTLKSEKVTK